MSSAADYATTTMTTTTTTPMRPPQSERTQQQHNNDDNHHDDEPGERRPSESLPTSERAQLQRHDDGPRDVRLHPENRKTYIQVNV